MLVNGNQGDELYNSLLNYDFQPFEKVGESIFPNVMESDRQCFCAIRTHKIGSHKIIKLYKIDFL